MRYIVQGDKPNLLMYLYQQGYYTMDDVDRLSKQNEIIMIDYDDLQQKINDEKIFNELRDTIGKMKTVKLTRKLPASGKEGGNRQSSTRRKRSTRRKSSKRHKIQNRGRVTKYGK